MLEGVGVSKMGGFCVEEKVSLRGLKTLLKSWNIDYFGNVHNNYQEVSKELNFLDMKEE